MDIAVFPGVTIDAAHSADLDDAIWVEVDGSGARVTVAIALVADHVAPGSDLDSDALSCGFTRYNSTSAVHPMLPRHLSESSLSLVPGPDRDVIVFDIALDRELEISSVEIVRGQLRNRGRLSHEAAGRLIESGEGDLGAMLRGAWTLSTALLEKRRRAGAIAYFSAGTGMLTDEEGHIIDLGTSEATSRAYVVVQEMMILANHAVSERLAKEGVHLLFRNHRGNPVADRDALSVDLELATQGGPLQAAAGKRLEMMIGKATLGSTAQGHFGLNLPVYARTTSPIRRYEDLVNQRILLNYIAGNPAPYAPEELQLIGGRLDALAREAAADKAYAFKALSEQRAGRLQKNERFGHLDQSDMTSVVKSAVESGRYTPGLISEIEARLRNGSLTSKDSARLLFAEGDEAAVARRLVVSHLEENTPAAVSILNFLHQDGWIGEMRWEETESSVGYRTTASTTFGGKSVIHVGYAGSKKMAKQKAAVGLLAAMAQIEWSPPASWAASPPARTPISASSDANTKGDLIGLCKARGLPSPEFEVTASGASHLPTFTAIASVSENGTVMRSPPMTAPSRRQSERLAAGALLELLHACPAGKPQADANQVNAKNALQELCQKRGWPLPVYEFEQSGPAHSPTFAGTVIVIANGRRVVSSTVSARSRKEAEKLAARDVIRSL